MHYCLKAKMSLSYADSANVRLYHKRASVSQKCVCTTVAKWI